MAKSKKAADQTDRDTDDSGIEQKVLKFAEQLGWLVGTVQAKSEGWLDRNALSAQVSRIRDSAAELVMQLGAQASQGSRESRAERGSRSSVKAPSEGKRKTAGGSKKRAMAALKPGRGPVDAPGKRHRQPPPSAPGIKKSDNSIAKEALWRSRRQRNPRG